MDVRYLGEWRSSGFGGGYSHLALAFDYISPHNETSHVGLGIVKGLCQGVVQWIVQQSIQAGLQGTQ